MDTQGQFYEINGIRLKVYVEGEGKPLLLLHGFPDSAKLWQEMMPHLVKAGYQVINFDQRGFGESDAPKGRKHYKMKYILSDALELLDQLGIEEKVYLIGHDWGAAIAWDLAIKYPERFEKLIALSVGHLEAFRRAGIKQKLMSWYMLFFQLRGIPERIYRANNWAVLRKHFRHHAGIEQFWIEDLSRPGRLTSGMNWYRANVMDVMTTKHKRCKVPALGVWSTEDCLLLEEQVTDSKKYMEAEWRYECMEGISHWIPLDAPERTAQLAIEWFGKKAEEVKEVEEKQIKE
jgi:pimeloyl-ACP methyl ester carboxylesterase